ncbi:MAG: hypothetical protein JRI61_13025, partial [Deltaproteobacteria bacterium]|nr:hypothetical protein [Deltaproteobacteria bacterium]
MTNAENQITSINLEPLTDHSAGFEYWKKFRVSAQKQIGLFSIKLNLPLGDLSSSGCQKLVKLTNIFGENVLRCGPDQNLYLRNIPERFLPNLYSELQGLDTPAFDRKFTANLIPCT